MDKSSFTDDLRRAREFQKFTVADIAAQTCIQVEYVYAIEQGEWESVPPAYLRGYIALIARTAGMNVEKVLLEFDRLIGVQVLDTNGAHISYDRPLLDQPLRVGDTRAKIRIGWFHELSKRRGLAYVVMVLLSAALLFGLIRARQSSPTQSALELPREALTETRVLTLAAPYTVIEVIPEKGADFSSNSAKKTALFQGTGKGTGWIVTESSEQLRFTYNYFDTVQFNYASDFQVNSFPLGTLGRILGSRTVTSADTISADTAIFIVSAKTLHD